VGLLTFDTLRGDYLPDVSASDTESEAILGRALDRVEGLISEYLGYPVGASGAAPTWASTSYTLRLRAVRGDDQRLLLPVRPVTAVASVYQDTNMEFAAADLVTSTDYETEHLRGGTYLHLLPDATSIAAWSTLPRSIKVSCTAGYTNEAAIPKALADAAYRCVADWWTGRRTRAMESTSQGGVSQTRGELKALPADTREILTPWMLLGRLGAR